MVGKHSGESLYVYSTLTVRASKEKRTRIERNGRNEPTSVEAGGRQRDLVRRYKEYI